MKVYQGY